ncbi:MFS transporter [Halobacteriales archaeon QS_8_69_26]|nr:MAG: MFS transporter [Halobacteriales archaeon QS_8_69_26]
MPVEFDRPSAPILKYYLYVATGAAWFIVPVWTLFLLEQGLSFTEVSVLNAAWWLATVLGEVPTGFVGDRIGRRNSLLLGSAASALAVVTFGRLSSFLPILAVYLVWGVGTTFRSGAEGAWLYDTLREETDEEEFTRIKGRGSAIRLGVMAVSALGGGYLAGVDMYLPFLATGVAVALGGAVAATMPKNRAYRAECRGDDRAADCPDADDFGPREAVPVIRDTLLAPPLRSFVVAVAAFYGVAWSVGMYTQPIAEDLALGWGMAEADLTGMLGWLYAGFSGVAALVTFNADRLERAIGPRIWVRVAPALLGVAFLASALVPPLAIPAFFLMRALLNATDVFKERFVNDHADSVGRATVLSATSMLLGLARVPFRLVSGAVGDLTSPLTAVGIAGGVLVAGAVAVVVAFGTGRDVCAGEDAPAVCSVVGARGG